ncbi:hypothetical protein PRVXH_002055 [Proteinivorax hydrogeniformans]|uniref:Uncharacterized protein n=1 Tax=Proteinivorax hydrogeniformans TaxID=1826727 RepID=A0AAU8HRE0_9FIRM
MEIIKNGQVYDAYNNATLVNIYDNGRAQFDPNVICDMLFINNAGYFFLYKQHLYNFVQNGTREQEFKKTIPLSRQDAYNWLKKHDMVSSMRKYFDVKVMDNREAQAYDIG